MIYEFLVPGPITGKARPRMNTRTGKAYTPSKTKNYEYEIKRWFINKYPNFKTLETRLKIQIIAYYDIPKSTTKKQAEKMERQIISPTKKPDIDNIAKIVLDALNKLAYKDDTQITKLEIEKVYADQAKLYISIEEY